MFDMYRTSASTEDINKLKQAFNTTSMYFFAMSYPQLFAWSI